MTLKLSFPTETYFNACKKCSLTYEDIWSRSYYIRHEVDQDESTTDQPKHH